MSPNKTGLIAAVLLAPALALAQTNPPQALPALSPPDEAASTLHLAQPAEGRLLDTVRVVAGNQPGPRMWKIKKGEHMLHVLATVSPLPSRMQWESAQVEGVIARSQAYIRAPQLGISANVGWISGMRLLPAYLRLRKNPDGATLKQVLPADLHARFSAVKSRYLPRDQGIEKLRPMLAAGELYAAALRRTGLEGKPAVMPVIDAAVKGHQLKIVSTALQVKVDDPKQALKELQGGGFDDAACLRETLDNIEQRLPDVVRQANAWATGDVAALRARPAKQGPDCLDALMASDFAKKRGIRDVPQRLRNNWVKAAEDALSRNASTFAVLSLEQVAGPDNYLDTMRAKGYEVIAP